MISRRTTWPCETLLFFLPIFRHVYICLVLKPIFSFTDDSSFVSWLLICLCTVYYLLYLCYWQGPKKVLQEWVLLWAEQWMSWQIESRKTWENVRDTTNMNHLDFCRVYGRPWKIEPLHSSMHTHHFLFFYFLPFTPQRISCVLLRALMRLSIFRQIVVVE